MATLHVGVLCFFSLRFASQQIPVMSPFAAFFAFGRAFHHISDPSHVTPHHVVGLSAGLEGDLEFSRLLLVASSLMSASLPSS